MPATCQELMLWLVSASCMVQNASFGWLDFSFELLESAQFLNLRIDLKVGEAMQCSGGI